MSNLTISPKTESHIRELFAQGRGYTSIAVATGLSRTQLYHWMRARDLIHTRGQRPEGRQSFSDEQLEEAERLFRERETTARISRQTGIGRTNLYRILREQMPDYEAVVSARRSNSVTVSRMGTDERAEIVEIYRSVGSIRETSHKTGRTRHAVREILLAAGVLKRETKSVPVRARQRYFDQVPEIWWVADDTYDGHSPEMIEHRRGIPPARQQQLLRDYNASVQPHLRLELR